jgi:hypothetical protein
VIKELVSRSDEIEGELRAFIDKKARPEVGFTPSPIPSTGPAPREPKSEGEERKAPKAKKKGKK